VPDFLIAWSRRQGPSARPILCGGLEGGGGSLEPTDERDSLGPASINPALVNFGEQSADDRCGFAGFGVGHADQCTTADCRLRIRLRAVGDSERAESRLDTHPGSGHALFEPSSY
jgi:hypothetical protein